MKEPTTWDDTKWVVGFIVLWIGIEMAIGIVGTYLEQQRGELSAHFR